MKKYTFLYLLLSTPLLAQTTLQVASKTIEKTFSGSKTIKIEAEKADIEILTWEKEEIRATIELIAKHPDKQTANQDLATMQQVTEKIGREIVLRNYLLLANEKPKPSSSLKAKYTIYLPEGMSISLHNTFGKIFVKGKTKQLNIQADFCLIELNDLEGNIKLDSQFGELKANNMNAIGSVFSERSDLFFNNLGGSWTIKNFYGKLHINSFDSIEKLNIDADKAEISLKDISLKNYNFLVVARFGKLFLPNIFSTKIEKGKQIGSLLSVNSPKINITNSFANITINQ